jgi:hypothetical protein
VHADRQADRHSRIGGQFAALIGAGSADATRRARPDHPKEKKRKGEEERRTDREIEKR